MNKNKRDAVIVAYGRSPLARAYKGSFADVHPLEFGAQTLKGVLDRLPGFDPALIDDVIAGTAFPQDKSGYNLGRMVAQKAGLPVSVPGVTVNRFCASGLQTIAMAANAIMADQMDVVVAGGIEQMTNLNMMMPEEHRDKELEKNIPGLYMSMGLTAENVAEKYGITRCEMDKMAADSHAKAAKAQETGEFDKEIIPVIVKKASGEKIEVVRDEGIRPGTTAEGLVSLKPCFKENGVVTAATSSQMTDGAGFVVIMARETAEKLGYKPIAKFVTYQVAGVPSEIMGIGPIQAVPKAMAKAGLTLDDMDVIEINEAFAAQSLACIRELNLPSDKVNPNGGAMALGHPLGATGAVLTSKVLAYLEKHGGKYGLITMCIGGGMGAAGILEME